MKKWLAIVLLLLSILIIMSISAYASEPEAIEPVYAPSTQLEARYIPLNLGYNQGTGWSTIYNPETAEMMVELARASRSIGKDTEWGKTMKQYGYEQLQFTENNHEYYIGWNWVEGQKNPISFPAVNAIIGIQDVVYNGRTRHAVVVTFRGSSDLEDWMCDFHAYSDLEGFHQGFSENAEYFYNVNSKNISFWIDGKKLSLFDIYDEMKTPDSDYCMLVMGHSLGGALTNLVVGRYLYQHGVHPSNLSGYGFAVPRTSPSSYVEDYPYDNIINIINADDLVPAVTLAGHERIGRDIIFRPDAEFRASHYAKGFPERENEPNIYWQTVGLLLSGGAPHLIDEAYADIVQIISDEITASTPENPSGYYNISTSGYNDWNFDAIISPNTFGDFAKDIHSYGFIQFDGGVLTTKGNLDCLHGIIMHNDNDYLLVNGNFNVGWGIHSDNPDHLTAGTVEIKGDFTTDNFNFYQYSYRATGTHRTILSGNKLQRVNFNDEDVRIENLYLRNANVNFDRYVPYMKLAEDGMIVATENLTVWELDLNGYELNQFQNIYTSNLTMNGGKLLIGGNAEIKTTQEVNGQMVISGNLDHNSTLIFNNGQVTVKGDCYLPATMIMKNDNDYLSVDGTLIVFARDWDNIPDDHLSAGTVEVKGNLEFDDCGICTENAYRETGTHRTILSGTKLQSLWWVNRAGGVNRIENLCIRNPYVLFYMSNDVRLGEDAYIKFCDGFEEPQIRIYGDLDMAGYDLKIDTSGYANTKEHPVQLKNIKSDGGSFYLNGDLVINHGDIEGDITINGNLFAVDFPLTFNNTQIKISGNCDISGLIMQNDNDYLLVEGNLSITASTYRPVDENHLTAGTVEAKGNFFATGSGHSDRIVYQSTGNHRTIFSGTGIQEVSLFPASNNKILRACLRNPNVIINATSTLILLEDTYQNDVSKWNIYNSFDVNGYKFVTPSSFNTLKNVVDSSSDSSGSLIYMQIDKGNEHKPSSVTVTCPIANAEDKSIHVLFTGYDSKGNMAVCNVLTFSSDSEMTQTLKRENWPECEYAYIYWLENNCSPLCNKTVLDW